eukprot:GFUD01041981.1.p1 GENE.GFUD01041981.1~~GFUD01041981.1.p1  ORF type:complete len:177 (+),score=23.23 GFUD01041981.1:58-588(+)
MNLWWTDSSFFNIVLVIGGIYIFIGLIAVFCFLCGALCKCCNSSQKQNNGYRSAEDTLDKIVVDDQKSKLTTHAINCHIHPTCCTDQDAEQFSRRRNLFSPVSENTVLKVNPRHFHHVEGGRFLRSDRKVPYWQCRKNSGGNFQVREKGKLYAYFDERRDCHFDASKSLRTRDMFQ